MLRVRRDSGDLFISLSHQRGIREMPRAAIAMKGARNDWTGVSAGGLESATKYPHGCHQNTRFYVTSWPLGNLARAPAITIGWAASRICRVARKSTHPLMSYKVFLVGRPPGLALLRLSECWVQLLKITQQERQGNLKRRSSS